MSEYRNLLFHDSRYNNNSKIKVIPDSCEEGIYLSYPSCLACRDIVTMSPCASYLAYKVIFTPVSLWLLSGLQGHSHPCLPVPSVWVSGVVFTLSFPTTSFCIQLSQFRVEFHIDHLCPQISSHSKTVGLRFQHINPERPTSSQDKFSCQMIE